MAPRNLVPRPAFRAGDPADVAPWTGDSIAAADRTDSPTGSRMAWKSTPARVPLGFTYEPGTEFYVAATLWVANDAEYELYIAPGDVPYGDADSKLPLARSGSSTYEEFTGTLTAGPLTGFYDPHGNQIEADPDQEAHLVVAPKQSSGAIALVRLDYSPTELTGYIDGDTPDTAEWTFSWDGTPRTSTSTALPVNVEPDPEDPTDPEDPVDPTDPDPWELHDRLARALGARVAAFVGQPGNPDVTATAEAQVPIVTEYVRGFTRGRGFRDESPAGPLRAVIVSGVARLATNPEQVAHFQTGDYSERPAQLAGWTLAELGVLHRYRRTTA